MKNNTNYKDLDHKELTEELIKLNLRRYNLLIKKTNQKLENFHEFKQVRKNIARIKTQMTLSKMKNK